MAATRLIAMHKNSGMSVGQSLAARVKYARDEEKTDDEEYVTSYGCNSDIAEKELEAIYNEYVDITGREYKGDIIAYQIRQSFKPGEITPEEANAIGYETAMRFTKGQHAFICCTHVDKAHIHNHVIFSSVNLSCDRKFRDSWFCGIGLRHLSDMICLEHGLSVIEPYKNKGVKPQYEKSYRQGIREAIDVAMSKGPKDFESLLLELAKEGYEFRRGKHLSLRGSGRKNFIKFNSLGDNYSVKYLKNQIEGNAENSRETHFDLLIDIQEKLKQGKGKGYARWGQKFNAKAIMNTLLYLDEKGIRSYEQLKDKAETSSADFKDLTDNIRRVESRIDELTGLRKQLRNYARTKDAFREFAKSGYSSRFYESNREEITVYKAAKKFFDSYGKDIPKTKDLNNEIEALVKEKSSYYKSYKQSKDDNRKIQEAKRNVDLFLQLDQSPKDKQIERSRTVR